MDTRLNDLLPVPRQVKPGDGMLDVAGLTWRIDSRSAEHTAIAWKLSRELQVNVAAEDLATPFTVLVGEPSGSAAEAPVHPEGYALTVCADGLVLRGTDASGLYWGLVTIEQLLGSATELPCCTIQDWPAISMRGHHDDISRKQISKVDDFRRIIRRLSSYKLNVYTPYMEDVLYIKSYPDIGVGRGRLTPDEVAAMHREAERHNVMIIPTYSLIGHQENLLAHEKYKHLGRRVFQPMSCYDVTKSEVRDFLHRVIHDVCELFPAPYFHAGFDEAIGVKGQELIDHANWCASELALHGKRMVMWADMFYNHFGIERIRELAPNVIPVNWCYGSGKGAIAENGHIRHHDELRAQGRPVWGLAGYSSWCKFVPEFATGKDNIDVWTKTAIETSTPALFCSQWGDNGYENNRDFPWNLIAYLGEKTWSGDTARRGDFESRFQQSFYGVQLPSLTDIIDELPGRLSSGAGEYWRNFRRGAFWAVRWAAANRDEGRALSRDEEALSAALAAVEDCKAVARRNAEHLDHFTVGLERTLTVIRRQKFGLDYVRGLSRPEMVQAVQELKKELCDVREHYIAEWIRTNKPQNTEVSLEVYSEVLDSYDFLLEHDPGLSGPVDNFLPLPLDDHFNALNLDISALPLDLWRCNGVPFQFAGRHSTHVSFNGESKPVELWFDPVEVADLHIIASGQRRTNDHHPALRVELLRNGEVVFAEDLLNVLHLCDWWAPLGEHIWAGGGMAHVDRNRVRYALKGGGVYGLTEIMNFAIPASADADGLRLTALCGDMIQLFATTIEMPRNRRADSL